MELFLVIVSVPILHSLAVLCRIGTIDDEYILCSIKVNISSQYSVAKIGMASPQRKNPCNNFHAHDMKKWTSSFVSTRNSTAFQPNLL